MNEYLLQIFQFSWIALSIILAVILLALQPRRVSLAQLPPRPNRLTPWDLLTAGGVWVLGMLVGIYFTDDGATIQSIEHYLITLATQVALAVTIVMLGWSRFTGRWKSFGLIPPTPQQWLRTLRLFVIVNGLVWATLALSQLLLQALNLDLDKHEFLEALGADPDRRIVALIILTAGLVAPIAEELLFRGLIQTFLLSILTRGPHPTPDTPDTPVPPQALHRWTAILLTTVFFVALHPWQHWPALVVLSIFLGHSYEKHRNLWAPITIHALFNCLQLALNLIVQGG